MTENPLAELSVQQLKRAVTIREKIEGLEKELNRITGGQAAPVKPGTPRTKRKMSAAARARISKAMKARWAKRRALKGTK